MVRSLRSPVADDDIIWVQGVISLLEASTRTVVASICFSLFYQVGHSISANGSRAKIKILGDGAIYAYRAGDRWIEVGVLLTAPVWVLWANNLFF